MSKAWTGGQYSLYRAVLGLTLILAFLRLPVSPPQAFAAAVQGPFPNLGQMIGTQQGMGLAYAAAGIILGLLLVVGKWDRIAAWILFFLLPWPTPSQFLISPIHVLLLLHVFTKPSPFGSLAALGRPDPGGGWHLNSRVPAIAWLFLYGYYLSNGLTIFSGEPISIWVNALLFAQLLFVPLAMWQRTRPFTWSVFLCGHLILAMMGEPFFPLVLVHLLAFDPSWLKDEEREEPEWVFYDGHCGLCHRTIRLLLAEDKDGSRFRFAPLQSATFESLVEESRRQSLPDSVVMCDHDGHLHIKSNAALLALNRLGGYWKVFAWLGALIPRGLRDGIYTGVATVRYRIFGQPEDACPIIPPELRGRFSF